MYRQSYQTNPRPYDRPPDMGEHSQTGTGIFQESVYIETVPKLLPGNSPMLLLLFLSILVCLALAIGVEGDETVQIADAPELFPKGETWSPPEEYRSLTAGERLDRYGKIFLDADKRPLTEEDLLLLQNDPVYSYKELLGYAVNSLYAAHGFDYRNNAKYQEKFDGQPWYHPKTTDEEQVVSKMNGYENQNRVFLANTREDISK